MKTAMASHGFSINIKIFTALNGPFEANIVELQLPCMLFFVENNVKFMLFEQYIPILFGQKADMFLNAFFMLFTIFFTRAIC